MSLSYTTTRDTKKTSPKKEETNVTVDDEYDDWEPELRKRKGNYGYQYYGSSKHTRKVTAKYK